MQLSIIIVNYNVKHFLEQCLYSVTKASKNTDTEIFVVDNNSSDGSEAFFAGKFSPVRFIWNKENVGFAKANNQALQLCTGKYILFLNPDTIVPEDCFSKCIAQLESDTTIGALGIQMIDGSGNFLKESKRGFPSPFAALCKLSGLATIFPRSKTFAKYYLGDFDKNHNHEVDVVSGAFMLIPKNIINSVGSFDETFFMYGEDVDLSYRIQKAGFKNYYFAESTIIHFKGESTRKLSVQYLRHFYGAMHLFVKKHYAFTTSSLLYILLQLIIWPLAIASMLINFFMIIIDLFTDHKYDNEKKKRLIVANGHAYTEIIDLLIKANVKLSITARVEPGRPDKHTALGTLENLSALIKKNSITEIIFCEEAIPFKDSMALITQYASLKIGYMFHAAGSSSIVGSNNKNSKGIFIAAK